MRKSSQRHYPAALLREIAPVPPVKEVVWTPSPVWKRAEQKYFLLLLEFEPQTVQPVSSRCECNISSSTEGMILTGSIRSTGEKDLPLRCNFLPHKSQMQ